MAHIPRIIGGRGGSVAVERSEWEPLGEGVWDLVVALECDRGEIGEGSVDLKKDMRERDGLSEPGLLAALLSWLCPSRLLEE